MSSALQSVSEPEPWRPPPPVPARPSTSPVDEGVAAGPSGLSPAHRGSCRVALVDARADELEADGRHAPALRALPVEVSRELMLPGAWSFAAEKLELSADEMDSWDELRDRLARA